MVWCGVVWCGVVWCGVVWCGVVWCGVVWCGVVWCGVVWCGVVWCGEHVRLTEKNRLRWSVSVIRKEHANAIKRAWRLPVVRARYTQRRRQCYKEGVEAAGGSCTLYVEKAPMLQRRRGGSRWFVHVRRREGANATKKAWRLPVVRARYTQRRRQCYKEGVEAAGGSCALYAEKAPMLQRRRGGCRWFVRVIRREGANATKKAWRLPVVLAR